MPPVPLGDMDPQPEPGGPPRGPDPPPRKGWAGVGAGGAFDLAGTEAAAIRAGQEADVREAAARLGPGATAEAISEDTLLPLWNVRRALGEVG